MYILDAIIIIAFLVGILGGLKRGLIKSLVLLIGLVLVVVVSYYLKNPVSAFFYKTLPFIPLGIVPKIFNIIIYEFLAFIIIFSVLYLILRIILKITGLIEKLLDATIILGFLSSLGGAVIGFIESYVIVFILLFMFSQPFMKITGVEESWLGNTILDKTPILSSTIENTRKVVSELETLKDLKNNSEKYNNEAIKLFIKYDIISNENVELLREKGKI